VSEERGPFAGWSLRRRVASWFLTLVVLLVIAFATVLYATFQLKDKGDALIDRWEPAYATSQTLLSDMVNQETGLRGYVLGKRPVFLQPYREYSVLQRRHEQQLRTAMAGNAGLLDDLAAFESAADAWRNNIAEKYIAEVRAGNPQASRLVSDLKGKAAFDRVRSRAATLIEHIDAVRARLKAQRRSAIVFCFLATIVAACLTLGSKYVLWRGLRRDVLTPIDALAAQTREVAEGAIDKHIIPSGPPEIADLGRDVDSMRAQIADELARVERARVVLMERGEELARSNADLEQFAYVASHDLSEPLRKVANFCQLLERQYSAQLDDKAKQYIAFAVDGAKRMQVLIADLLAFSRVGRTTEGFGPVDTNQALSRALATLDDRIVAAHAQIEHGELPTVDGDLTLLVALFQNLVGNALKYHDPARPPRIEISAVREGPNWHFTVSDNGIGIDRQYAERIFTIFQRLHLRDKYGGTGIGLALCRKIVEFHRGKFWLAEHEGPGATFAFLIPERAQQQADFAPDLAETVAAHEH
jgi:signal transduction histidine kinase